VRAEVVGIAAANQRRRGFFFFFFLGILGTI